jgi:hypothetical protein
MFNEETDDFFANLPEEQVHEALKPPAPWAEGEYPGTITAAAKYQGEGKEYPCVKVTVQVANSEGKTKNVNAWIMSKSPKAVEGSLRTLAALGLSHKQYAGPSSLVGLSAPVKLGIRTTEDGSTYNEFKNFVFKRNR